MPGLFGSLLGAVAGPLVSGILGGRAERRAQQHADQANATKIQVAVADAKAAGINPLEAIRGGAGNIAAPTIPRLASAAAFGNAFDRINDVLTGRQAQKTADADVQADLDSIAADTAARGKIQSVGAGSGVATGFAGPAAPSLISSAMRQSATPPEVQTAVDIGAPQPFTQGLNPQVTNPWHENTGLYANPNLPDAQAIEERYGDVGSAVYGLGAGVSDLGYSAGRAVSASQESDYFAELYRLRAENGGRATVFVPRLTMQQIEENWVGDFGTGDRQTAQPWMGGTTR